MRTFMIAFARIILTACILATVGFAFAPARIGAHLFPWDKADHFAAFFAITTAAVLAFPRLSIVWMVVLVSAAGGVIELAQGLPMIGRDCDVRDWLAEIAAIAAVVGLLVVGQTRQWLAADPQVPRRGGSNLGGSAPVMPLVQEHGVVFEASDDHI